MTLTEFLLARIAEDESGLKLMADHDGWYDRDRYWAECEAKRRMVVRAVHMEGMAGTSDSLCIADLEYAEQVLPLLALPYSDHPDFDEAWLP